MEKLRNINVRDKRVRIAGSLIMASGLVFSGAQAEGKIPYVPIPVPLKEFHPVILNEKELNQMSSEIYLPLTSKELQAPTPKPSPEIDWETDPEISWYGPNFYGKRTACGLELTEELVGVAHRDLPCGTLVTFEWNGVTLEVPVVDRGPYVEGRIFDLTGGACLKLDHCFTGKINYVIKGQEKKIPN